MKVFQNSSAVFPRQRDVKNCQWKLSCRKKVRRDYIVGQEFSSVKEFSSVSSRRKKESFHQMNIQIFSALKKIIYPDKTKRVSHDKQETLLARQKKTTKNI